jgi:hypothetical protein
MELMNSAVFVRGRSLHSKCIVYRPERGLERAHGGTNVADRRIRCMIPERNSLQQTTRGYQSELAGEFAGRKSS